MKGLNRQKGHHRTIVAIMVGLLFLFITVGCDHSDDIPDYIGTWVLEDDFTIEITQNYQYTVSMRLTLRLDADGTYVMFYEFENTETEEYEFVEGNESTSGTYQVDGNSVTLTIMQREYLEGTWQQTLDSPETAAMTFILSGDTLTVYHDENDDGDTEDEMETLVFMRTQE